MLHFFFYLHAPTGDGPDADTVGDEDRVRAYLEHRGDLPAEVLNGIGRGFLHREQKARRLIMMIYEGHPQTYSLYGNRSLLQTMAADMMRALT